MINKDPFSNGTECDMFMSHNCERCQNNSVYDEKTGLYSNADEQNLPLCPILKDIMLRMISDNPISEETVKICDDFVFNGTFCPRLKPIEDSETKKETDKVTFIITKEDGLIEMYKNNFLDKNHLTSTKGKTLGLFIAMLSGTLDEMKDGESVYFRIKKNK